MNQKTGTEYRLLRWLHRSGRPGCLAVMILHAALCFPQAAAPKFWAYVGPQYVITAEAAGSYGVVLNFINLTDFVIVVQPNEFIYKGSSGRFYIGQVFDHESQDNRGETFKYSASILLKGHSFTGLTVLGAFHEQDAVDELSVRIGAKRYYLVPLEKVEFEQLAARIGELDLENASPRALPSGRTVIPLDGVQQRTDRVRLRQDIRLDVIRQNRRSRNRSERSHGG